MTKRAVGAPAAKKAPAAPKTTTKSKKAGKAGARPAARTPRTTKQAATSTVDKLLAAPGVPDPAMDLTPTQVAFANEYLKDLNGTAAYRRIHPNAAISTCATESSRILRNPKVRTFIESERQKLTERFGYSKEELVAELVAIVRADPTELTALRHTSCDSCWGGEEKQGMWAEPDPDCPGCSGEGIARPWFADTRKLSAAARALFQSVEVTAKGMRVHMESKADARDKLAKILGAYELDNKQKSNPLLDLLAAMGGLKHALSNANEIEVRLLAALGPLLERATLVETMPDRLGRPDVKSVQRYEAAVKVGDETLGVGVVVRELKDGHRFYDHFVLKDESPGGISEATSEGDQSLGDQPALGDAVSVSDPEAPALSRGADAGGARVSEVRQLADIITSR